MLVLLLWALERVTAPHAHPQHSCARTAQRTSVASIGTLRMTAIEHTEHTHTHAASHAAAAAASNISHDAVGVPFFVLSFRYHRYIVLPLLSLEVATPENK